MESGPLCYNAGIREPKSTREVKMIKKIAGQNFEGYPSLEMEFSPGVNTIIGESDKGKSAVFNLIEWIRTNRPLGDNSKSEKSGIRSEWGGDTIAEIWTTDGHYIKRVRTDTRNEYWIDDAQKPLVAFGHNPPAIVDEILMIDDVNVQIQDEPPFLLKETSGGEIARILNKAASLEDIDLSISNLSKGLKEVQHMEQSAAQSLENRESDLLRYTHLSEIEEKINELEQMEKYKGVMQGQKIKLTSLHQIITDLTGKLKKMEHLDIIEKQLVELKRLQNERVQLQSEKEKLMERKQAWEKLTNSVSKMTEALTEMDSVIYELQKDKEKLAKYLPPKCPLCGRSDPNLNVAGNIPVQSIDDYGPFFPPNLNVAGTKTGRLK